MEEKIDLLVRYTAISRAYEDYLYLSTNGMNGTKYTSVARRVGYERARLAALLGESVGLNLDKEFPI